MIKTWFFFLYVSLLTTSCCSIKSVERKVITNFCGNFIDQTVERNRGTNESRPRTKVVINDTLQSLNDIYVNNKSLVNSSDSINTILTTLLESGISRNSSRIMKIKHLSTKTPVNITSNDSLNFGDDFISLKFSRLMLDNKNGVGALYIDFESGSYTLVSTGRSRIYLVTKVGRTWEVN